MTGMDYTNVAPGSIEAGILVLVLVLSFASFLTTRTPI
jgi:hypothetical protein